MYRVVRAKQRKRIHTEVFLAFPHLVRHPGNELEVRRLGPVDRYEDITLMPGGDFPGKAPGQHSLVIVLLAGELEYRDRYSFQRLTQNRVLCTTLPDPETYLLRCRSSHKTRVVLMTFDTPAEQRDRPAVLDLSRLDARGTLVALLSGAESDNGLRVEQDLTLYRSELRKDENLVFETLAERQTYIHLLKGTLRLGPERLYEGDSARVYKETFLEMTGREKCHFLLLDLP